MNSRLLYRSFIVLLMVSTLTCNLVMVSFLQKFFYGDLDAESPETLHRLVSSLGTRGNLGFPDYKDVVESTDAFDKLAAGFIQRGTPIFLGDDVLWTDVCWATGGFASLIGDNKPLAGRFFNEDDDYEGSTKVAVLNQATWTEVKGDKAFESGTIVFIKGQPFEVIGIVKNKFPYLNSMEDVDIWIPAKQNPDSWQFITDDYQEYQVLARLDPSKKAVAEQQLDAALDDIEERLGFVYTADVMSETEFRINRSPQMHKLFIALFVVTGFLFVLGTVNQLLMLVSRSTTLSSDLKVMLALGATAKHVSVRFIRAFLLLISISLAGVAIVSMIILQLYNALWGGEYGVIPVVSLLSPLSLGVLGSLTLLLAALHMTFPLFLFFAQGDQLFFRERSAGSGFSMKSALSVSGVGLQIGLVTIMILGCGAFLHSMGKEGSIEASPYESRLLCLELAFASKEAQEGSHYRIRFDAIDNGLKKLGGIESIGTSASLPLSQAGWTRGLVEGEEVEKEPEWIAFDEVSPGFFDTIGLDFIEGQDFLPEDATKWPYERYVVNQAYVDRFLPDGLALGRKIAPWDGVGFSPIIGIVENSPLSINGTTKPIIYIPAYKNRFILNIRLSDPSLTKTHLTQITDTILAADSGVIVVSANTVETIWSKELSSPRLGFYLLMALSGVGLILSVSGIFGYQSYIIMLREREFAIKHALGLSTQGIYKKEVTRGFWIELAGLILGIAAFIFGMRYFGANFYEAELPLPGILLISIGLLAAFVGVMALASLGSTKPKLQMLMRE